MPTRQQLLERKKAVETAVQIKDSKVGTCVLKDNARQANLRCSQVSRLEQQLKREQMHLEQEKKVFLKLRASRQLDPTLLLERPGSADSDSTSLQTNMPSYMRPLKSEYKPSIRVDTVDAFTKLSTRTTRPWQIRDNDRPVFRSFAFPSEPLNTPEVQDLQQKVHNRRSEEVLPAGSKPSLEQLQQHLQNRAERREEEESVADSFDTRAFITQVTGLQVGKQLKNNVRFVGIRSPESGNVNKTPVMRKALNLPLLPVKGKKPQKKEESQFKSRYAELEFKAKLRDFEAMTKPMASQWYRMKKRCERLPSADGLALALRDDTRAQWSSTAALSYYQ